MITIVVDDTETKIPCRLGDAVYAKIGNVIEPVTIDAVQIKAHGIRIRTKRFTRPGMENLYLDPNERGLKWFVAYEDAEMAQKKGISGSGKAL